MRPTDETVQFCLVSGGSDSRLAA